MYIYLITNRITGKYYVGKTTRTIQKRWNQHIYCSNRPDIKGVQSPYLYNSIRKHGPDNFKIETLCECPNELSLNAAEKFFIWITGSSKRSLGYNGTLGGDGGIPTEATRKKLSLLLTGKPKPPRTPEHKEKLREAARLSWAIRREKIAKEDGEKPEIILNKGKKIVSDQTRENMSKASLGKKKKPRTPEHQEKLNVSHRNKSKSLMGIPKVPWSEERKLAKSVEMTGKHRGPYKKRTIVK